MKICIQRENADVELDFKNPFKMFLNNYLLCMGSNTRMINDGIIIKFKPWDFFISRVTYWSLFHSLYWLWFITVRLQFNNYHEGNTFCLAEDYSESSFIFLS